MPFPRSGRRVHAGVLGLATLAAAASSACAAGRVEPAPGAAPASGNEVLREAPFCGATDPFVAVVRDASTWAALARGGQGEWPDLAPRFFETHVVVAAFLGERPTPGYRPEITRGERARFRVAEHAPPKDAILAQVVTSPCQVVAAPRDDEAGTVLELDEGLRRRTGRAYRVEASEFEVTGGIEGRRRAFPVRGEVRVTRRESLATLLIDLEARATESARWLRDTVTVIAAPDGTLDLPPFHAGRFVDPPCQKLSGRGALGADGSELTLDLASVPCKVSDAFSGRGRISGIAPAR